MFLEHFCFFCIDIKYFTISTKEQTSTLFRYLTPTLQCMHACAHRDTHIFWCFTTLTKSSLCTLVLIIFLLSLASRPCGVINLPFLLFLCNGDNIYSFSFQAGLFNKHYLFSWTQNCGFWDRSRNSETGCSGAGTPFPLNFKAYEDEMVKWSLPTDGKPVLVLSKDPPAFSLSLQGYSIVILCVEQHQPEICKTHFICDLNHICIAIYQSKY